MKSYPSIPKLPRRKFKAHIFDKIDGSNLRFEWSKKRGWYKQGTRRRLFDETDPVFGQALPLFLTSLAESLEKIFVSQRWDRAIAFAEYWGPQSFSGLHTPGDDMRLSLIDVSVHRKGILLPQAFVELFGHLDTATYLGQAMWGPELVSSVRQGSFEGVTFEGVVGKALVKNQLVMAKAKTQAWIDKVLEVHGAEQGAKIIDS